MAQSARVHIHCFMVVIANYHLDAQHWQDAT